MIELLTLRYKAVMRDNERTRYKNIEWNVSGRELKQNAVVTDRTLPSTLTRWGGRRTLSFVISDK